MPTTSFSQREQSPGPSAGATGSRVTPAKHVIAATRAEALRAWSLMAPLYGLILLVIVFPEIWAFYLSFTDYSVGRTAHVVGLANYSDVLQSSEFWKSTVRTLVFAAIAVSLEISVGLALSCILNRKMVMRGLIIAALIAPIAMSQAVTSAIWSYLLDFNVGPLNYLTGVLGLGRHQWLSSAGSALIVVALVEFWAGMPHVLIMLYPVRASLPEGLYEAAEMDGASTRQLFQWITWPLMAPAVLVAAIFRIIITMRAFGVIWILTKGGPMNASEILSIYLYKIGFSYFEFGHAAAIAWLVLLLTAVAASFYIFRLYAVSFAAEG